MNEHRQLFDTIYNHYTANDIRDEVEAMSAEHFREAFTRLDRALVQATTPKLNFQPVTEIDNRTALKQMMTVAAEQLARLERFAEVDPYDGTAVIYARLNRPGVYPMEVVFLRIESGQWYSSGAVEFPQRATWQQLTAFLVAYDIQVWDVLIPKMVDGDTVIDDESDDLADVNES